MPSLLRKGGFAPVRGKSPAPAARGKTSPGEAKVDKKAEKKEKDEVVVLKDRLAKGHRLNDQELAQVCVARRSARTNAHRRGAHTHCSH